MSLRSKVQDIQTRIEAALQRSPYGKRSVVLIGASKAQSLKSIREAAEWGVLDMGENYAQELIAKAPLCLDLNIRWHYIGRLQSNKIRFILPYVSLIQSVDSLELAKRISKAREGLVSARSFIPVLLQVNLGSERQKSGLAPHVIEQLFSEFVSIEGIKIMGLMTIPPVAKDPEKSRPHFKAMKALFDHLKAQHPEPKVFEVLSMGMSADFEIAVEEGSTCVRVGTSLFGPRPSRTESNFE